MPPPIAPADSICIIMKPGQTSAMPPTASTAMRASASPSLKDCNCAAIRQAARHVTQFYDQLFAPVGLRATQFAILSRLQRDGPMTINALAAALVMDRTTLGRNILPLQRDGLVAIGLGRTDRRSKEVHLTRAGAARFRAAAKGWREAQTRFEAAFGRKPPKPLRALLHHF